MMDDRTDLTKPNWYIDVPEVHYTRHAISKRDAVTLEAALELVKDGDGTVITSEYSHTLELDEYPWYALEGQRYREFRWDADNQRWTAGERV